MYKVLNMNNRGEITSCVVSGKAERKYSEVLWTKGMDEIHGLTAFADLETAIRWITTESYRHISHDHEVIYEIETIDEIPLPEFCSIGDLYAGRFVPNPSSDWPEGTRMFKKVRLLKRVPPEKLDEMVKEMYP